MSEWPFMKLVAPSQGRNRHIDNEIRSRMDLQICLQRPLVGRNMTKEPCVSTHGDPMPVGDGEFGVHQSLRYLRSISSPPRPRHHGPRRACRECADLRQDDPPASAGCAITARPRSFRIRRARRARRCTASATCATGRPSGKNCSTTNARCIPDTIAFCNLTNVHSRADGKLPRFGRSKQKRNDCPTLALDGAGFRRSCEVLRGNVAGHGCAGEAGGGPGGEADGSHGRRHRGEHRVASTAGSRAAPGRPRVGPRLC